jgi:hypothetical protein
MTEHFYNMFLLIIRAICRFNVHVKPMTIYTGICGCETVTTPVEKVNDRKNAKFEQK